MELGRSGNRNNPRLLCEQPCERHLRGRSVLLCCEILQEVDEDLIRFSILFVKARNDVAEIRFVELSVLVNLSSQEPFSKRTERDKADTELLAGRQNFVLRLSPPQRVFILQSCNGLDRMRATYSLHSRF